MMRHLTTLLLAFLLMTSLSHSSPVELKLMMTNYHQTNQQKIVFFLKKLVEERSNGRLLIKIAPAPSLSPDQPIENFLKQPLSLVLIEANQLRNQATSLKSLNLILSSSEQRPFYPWPDTSMGCALHSELREADLELLALWDSAQRQPEAPETLPAYNTSVLLMAQKQWSSLAADTRIIIHEALYTVTLYASELAHQYDTDQISTPVRIKINKSAAPRKHDFKNFRTTDNPAQDQSALNNTDTLLHNISHHGGGLPYNI